jgi:hypothetical protein
VKVRTATRQQGPFSEDDGNDKHVTCSNPLEDEYISPNALSFGILLDWDGILAWSHLIELGAAGVHENLPGPLQKRGGN